MAYYLCKDIITLYPICFSNIIDSASKIVLRKEFSMTACRITELKKFMSHLLGSDCFDSFLLKEASIVTYNTFLIDGQIRKEFYPKEERDDPGLHPYELSRWKDMRPLCFSLIKGTNTPLSFKFVLHLIPDAAEKMIQKSGDDISPGFVHSFVVTIRYDGSDITCTTGVSLSGFSLDKTAETLWDKTFLKFLEKKEIGFEPM